MLTTRGRAGLARQAAAPDRNAPPADAAPDDEDECPAFGYLRGLHDRAVSIEFRFATGNRKAFPYSWLGTADYNPSAGILLKFVGDLVYLVLIEGSHLNALVKGAVSLYDRGLQRHRITWVREMDRQQAAKAGAEEVTVERIRTLAYRPDEEPKGVAWLEAFRECA